MDPFTAFAIFILFWWVTFFAVLPFGVRSSAEAREATLPGNDEGAPVQPQLLRKALITTGIASVLTTLFLMALALHWLDISKIAIFANIEAMMK